MSISINTIIEEAIDLLNQKGIDYLTMRELASRLNIKAASLYWHIKNKEELFSLIAESICKKIPLDNELDNSREHISRIVLHYRENLLKVKDSEKIFSIIPPMTPARIELIKTMLINLKNLGVPKEKLIQSGNLINNFVLSFVADEVKMKRYDSIQADFFFGFPIDMDFDKQFVYGLEVLLNGIETTK